MENGSLVLASQFLGVQSIKFFTVGGQEWIVENWLWYVIPRYCFILLVVIVLLSILEDEELSVSFTSNPLPHLLDIVEYFVIKCKVHRWRREAKDMLIFNRQCLGARRSVLAVLCRPQGLRHGVDRNSRQRFADSLLEELEAPIRAQRGGCVEYA